MADSTDVFERKDDQPDRLTSLYGLTPKVETAILEAVQSGAVRRVRTLIAPLHPADQADLLERMPTRSASAMVRLLGDNLDAETLTYVDEGTREAIIEAIGPDALARQLQDLSTDDAINIVEELEQDDLQEVLAALSAEDRVLVEEGLSFPEDSAGRLMQREIVTVPSFWTVGQTIDFLRSGKSSIEDFYLIFVIDPSRRPLGEIALSRLLCAQRPRRVSELMNTDFRSIPVDMDQEEVAVLFRRYGMVSAGVVDPQKRLVGMITNDDVIDVIDEEAEEDLLALAGVGDANLRSGLWETLQGRSSWLFLNLFTS